MLFIKHLLKYSNKHYEAPRCNILMRPLCCGWFEYCFSLWGAAEARRACRRHDALLKIYLGMQIRVIIAPTVPNLILVFLIYIVMFGVFFFLIIWIFVQFRSSIDGPRARSVMQDSATWPHFCYMWSTLWINLIVTFDYLSAIVKGGRRMAAPTVG